VSAPSATPAEPRISSDFLTAPAFQLYRRGMLLARAAPLVPTWLTGLTISELAPHMIAGHLVSAIGGAHADPFILPMLSRRAAVVLGDALGQAFGEDYSQLVHHPRRASAPWRPDPTNLIGSTQYRRRFASTNSDLSYGPCGRDNLLDIWRHPNGPARQRAPVLIQIPGGAWTVNGKRGQAYPLMGRMTEQGWMCVSINYRRSPRHSWPDHIVDVKRAVAWVRRNIADYGGDPDFIAVTGGSAGGHLSALSALTPNDPRLQPGFESADTSVQAAVPLYGVYDLTDPAKMQPVMLPYLERFVLRARIADAPAVFELASPISHVNHSAPPFFVIHGRGDSLIPCVQARAFTSALRRSGAVTVCHAELPDAQHAFDLIATVRCQLVTDAIAQFLGIVYGRHLTKAGRSCGTSAG